MRGSRHLHPIEMLQERLTGIEVPRLRIRSYPPLMGLTTCGMGLFLTKEIIKRHGGEIWYEARHNGSDFVFTLPK